MFERMFEAPRPSVSLLRRDTVIRNTRKNRRYHLSVHGGIEVIRAPTRGQLLQTRILSMGKNMKHVKARLPGGTLPGDARSSPVRRITALALFATMILIMPSAAGAQKNCQSLKSFVFPKTTINDAKLDDGGKYTTVENLSFANLPSSCRVTAEIKPTNDSDINIEVWLPLSQGR